MSLDPNVFPAGVIKSIRDRNLSFVSINTPTYPISGRLPNDPNIDPIFKDLGIKIESNDTRPYIDYTRGGRIAYLNNLL